ncbi:hypothetical protein LAZ67_1001705 [Cordylochernes scorpioides]|uniref:Tc1-like transposase DDE domain-containing protein n=1 Tax=Cordylochernes scorpioides TaxID=51811 RepID=A0ABY6JVL9_9ARAC|nr:hypothetical protein LAZ67_1001705 [Cordylochernes scorpioides]
MDWPARSPDLNPIEHVWDTLGRRIGTRHPSPRTLVELRTALLEEWGLLPLDLLQSMVNSMRARCETLIAVRAPFIPAIAAALKAAILGAVGAAGPYGAIILLGKVASVFAWGPLAALLSFLSPGVDLIERHLKLNERK